MRSGGRLSGGNAAASQFETLVVLAAIEALAAAQTRHRAAVAAAARSAMVADGTGINPAAARGGQFDVMARLGLSYLFSFIAKLHRVSAGQAADVQPQMNHLMLENLADRDLWRIAEYSTHQVLTSKERVTAVGIDQKRDRKMNDLPPHIDVPGSAREPTAPGDLAGRQATFEILVVKLTVE